MRTAFAVFFYSPAVLARRAGRPPRELANTRTAGRPRMRTAFAVFCFGPVVLARRAGRPPRELANTRTIGHPRMRTAFAFFCPAVLARRAGRPSQELAGDHPENWCIQFQVQPVEGKFSTTEEVITSLTNPHLTKHVCKID